MRLGNKLDEQYQNLLSRIWKYGNQKEDRTGTGTNSLFGEGITHSMSEGFPLLTTKKMFTKGVIEELLWILRGETNIRPLVLKGVNIWNGDAFKRYQTIGSFNSNPLAYKDNNPQSGLLNTMDEFVERIKTDEEFAKVYGDLGRIYGAQWRGWKTHGTKDNVLWNMDVDQVSELIAKLQNSPDDRRMIVSAWKVDEIGSMTLPPCHNFFQCYTRKLTLVERNNFYTSQYLGLDCVSHEELDEINIPTRGLSLMWNQRSVDTFLGLPFNIASYGFLLEILSKIVNMVPEKLVGTFGDTHLYSNHIDAVKTQLDNENIHLLPQLELSGTFDNLDKYYSGTYFELDKFLKDVNLNDFTILDYASYPTIKAPLSN